MARLFFLEASGGGRILSGNADGSDWKVIISGARIPDGIVVDLEAGHIYWTNMGVPTWNDGSIAPISTARIAWRSVAEYVPGLGPFAAATPTHS